MRSNPGGTGHVSLPEPEPESESNADRDVDMGDNDVIAVEDAVEVPGDVSMESFQRGGFYQ